MQHAMAHEGRLCRRDNLNGHAVAASRPGGACSLPAISRNAWTGSQPVIEPQGAMDGDNAVCPGADTRMDAPHSGAPTLYCRDR